MSEKICKELNNKYWSRKSKEWTNDSKIYLKNMIVEKFISNKTFTSKSEKIQSIIF